MTAKKPAADTVTPLITISAEPVEEFPIKLVDRIYMVNRPKTSLAMKLAQQSMSDTPTDVLASLREWVESAFGERAFEVLRRMDDPKDLLDVQHLTQLMGKMVELASENPTT